MDERARTPRARRGVRLAAVVLAAALPLVACGDEEPTTAPGSPTSPSELQLTGSPEGFVPGNPDNEVRAASAAEQADWPACEDVWVPAEGPAEIPADYRGCVIGDEAVVADRIRCSFGGSMTTFDDRYYGVLGAVVNDAQESLATSRDYATAYGQCTG